MSQYGHSAGRPPSAETVKRLAGPCCEKCAHMVTTSAGRVLCARFTTFVADAGKCPEFDDASRDRTPITGGTSGIMAPW